MSYVENKYYIIPDNVWWYSQCWTYNKSDKFKTDGIYICMHSVFFDYSLWFTSSYIPFTTEGHLIKLTQHELVHKKK